MFARLAPNHALHVTSIILCRGGSLVSAHWMNHTLGMYMTLFTCDELKEPVNVTTYNIAVVVYTVDSRLSKSNETNPIHKCSDNYTGLSSLRSLRPCRVCS